MHWCGAQNYTSSGPRGAKNFDKLTYKLGVTFPLYIPYVKERLEVKKEPVQVLWPWVLKLS